MLYPSSYRFWFSMNNGYVYFRLDMKESLLDYICTRIYCRMSLTGIEYGSLNGFSTKIFPGNSRAMRPQWCGRCSCTSTSFTPRTGTIGPRCPHSSSCMASYSQSRTHSSALDLASSFTMRLSASSVSPECTSTTSTRMIMQPSGSRSSTC